MPPVELLIAVFVPIILFCDDMHQVPGQTENRQVNDGAIDRVNNNK